MNIALNVKLCSVVLDNWFDRSAYCVPLYLSCFMFVT